MNAYNHQISGKLVLFTYLSLAVCSIVVKTLAKDGEKRKEASLNIN